MARYSDIRKGPELAEAFTKMNVYLGKSRAAKRTAYQANRAKPNSANWVREKGFINPFNTPGTILYETSVIAATQTITPNRAADTARLLAADYVSTPAQLTAGATVIRIPKFRFAKILCTDRDGTGVDRNSRVTDLPYKQYIAYSASASFGQNRTTPGDYPTARAAIIAAPGYTTFLAQEGSRISILPERS
jgi:hypothetical protein